MQVATADEAAKWESTVGVSHKITVRTPASLYSSQRLSCACRMAVQKEVVDLCRASLAFCPSGQGHKVATWNQDRQTEYDVDLVSTEKSIFTNNLTKRFFFSQCFLYLACGMFVANDQS